MDTVLEQSIQCSPGMHTAPFYELPRHSSMNNLSADMHLGHNRVGMPMQHIYVTDQNAFWLMSSLADLQ